MIDPTKAMRTLLADFAEALTACRHEDARQMLDALDEEIKVLRVVLGFAIDRRYDEVIQQRREHSG